MTACTVCKLAIEWSPEKGGMVDISGSTYCPDLEPHRPDQIDARDQANKAEYEAFLIRLSQEPPR